MNMKKTIKIEDLKNKINDFLLNSKDELISDRLSMGNLLEEILMEYKNYKGFTYLTSSDMEESDEGTTFGIRWGNSTEERFVDTDRSRIVYF